jgi:hypothetical protein
MTSRRNNDRNGEPERESDSDMTERVSARRNHDSARPDGYQRERSESFDDAATRER